MAAARLTAMPREAKVDATGAELAGPEFWNKAPPLVPGCSLGVRYKDEPALYHERLIVGRGPSGKPNIFVGVSPDGDLELMDLALPADTSIKQLVRLPDSGRAGSFMRGRF